ncbi:MAG: hypothetical protein ACLTDS_02405 [Bianqueaceae bacterium]
MHAGMANNGSGRRAHGANSPSPAARRPCRRGYKRKCTPAWRTTTATSGHTEIIPRRHSRNDHAGGDKRKCTPVRRAMAATSGHTVPISAASAKTTMPAGIQNENARR